MGSGQNGVLRAQERETVFGRDRFYDLEGLHLQPATRRKARRRVREIPTCKGRIQVAEVFLVLLHERIEMRIVIVVVRDDHFKLREELEPRIRLRSLRQLFDEL